MSLELNREILDKYNLTTSQYLLLWALKKSENIKSDIALLRDREYIKEDSTGNYTLVGSTKLLLENIYLASAKKEKSDDSYYTRLATALKEIYPKGKKPGTNIMWRGNTVEIVKKLKLLNTSYKFEFTFDQAVDATRRYVASFNGDYTNMRVLKYFLLKSVTELDAEGNRKLTTVSDFMSLIENEDQEEAISGDWMDKVR